MHRATLLDGTVVACKVQYPEVADYFAADVQQVLNAAQLLGSADTLRVAREVTRLLTREVPTTALETRATRAGRLPILLLLLLSVAALRGRLCSQRLAPPLWTARLCGGGGGDGARRCRR